MNSKYLISDLIKLKIGDFEKKYESLGEGMGRKVFALNDDCIVKVAKGVDGLHQNRVEHYVYNNTDLGLQKYLCPIIFYNSEILIMKRAIPLCEIVKDKYINISQVRHEKDAEIDLKRLSEDYYLLYEDIISTSSWGIINNENVLIDYGCTTEIGDFIYDMEFMFYKDNDITS